MKRKLAPPRVMWAFIEGDKMDGCAFESVEDLAESFRDERSFTLLALGEARVVRVLVTEIEGAGPADILECGEKARRRKPARPRKA